MEAALLSGIAKIIGELAHVKRTHEQCNAAMAAKGAEMHALKEQLARMEARLAEEKRKGESAVNDGLEGRSSPQLRRELGKCSAELQSRRREVEELEARLGEMEELQMDRDRLQQALAISERAMSSLRNVAQSLRGEICDAEQLSIVLERELLDTFAAPPPPTTTTTTTPAPPATAPAATPASAPDTSAAAAAAAAVSHLFKVRAELAAVKEAHCTCEAAMVARNDEIEMLRAQLALKASPCSTYVRMTGGGKFWGCYD